MKITRLNLLLLFFVIGCSQPQKQNAEQKSESKTIPAQTDPLPSWSDGASKKAIMDFVASVTTKGNKDYVPVEERIACFDNDGTLWSEQPVYFQTLFMSDRIKQLAPQHPEWKKQQPF